MLAILSTVCCCLPFGIVAIVHAAKASSLAGQGNYRGAQAAAGKAKFWALLGGGLGLIVIVLYVVLLIVAESQRF